ncbi:preprotein translocase subunit YajC [Antiquaquibacter soli]|uniref:Preprotein translocase subunit YajC n=1 Tax=Antiquaquibacter soli TaxID=3064523 RepID=A0ABT9BM22_9MICO|nr:preprotein translocase subunit YajC [Protaetiibacter sp. WY-16]MDO7882048.1 preprotein translocase subunit YajC [Protaetiibacter sp. WY-16]
MDPLTIGMLVILAVLIFFMFRNSRKRRQQAEELQTKMVPGARVMTNYGLFGTLKAVDEVANQAELEISPGVVVTVHRQTLAKVVDETAVEPGAPRSVEEAMEIANREQAEREAAEAAEATEPAYGERVEPAKKPRSTKKTGE